MLTQDTTRRWLTESYDYEPPHRGEVRKGVILSIDAQGITVDVGLKRDGFVPQADVEHLEEEAGSDLKTGQEVITCVVQPHDQNGNLILSLYDHNKISVLAPVGTAMLGRGVGDSFEWNVPAGLRRLKVKEILS